MLQHVLDALAATGRVDPIVVIGPDSNIGPLVHWGASVQVVNPDPSRGLASSLQAGWAAALAAEPAPEAILVVLGDQPRLRPEVVASLASVPLDPARPIVVARFRDSDARNPVRIDVTAARLVEATTGDRGLGPVLEAHPALVRWLEFDGDNPDVDSPEDLRRLVSS